MRRFSCLTFAVIVFITAGFIFSLPSKPPARTTPQIPLKEEPLKQQVSQQTARPVVAEKHAEAPAEQRFGEWLARFANAPTAERNGLLAEGRALAIERRARMKDLIATKPAEALKYVIRDSVRVDAGLPPEIIGQLERNVESSHGPKDGQLQIGAERLRAVFAKTSARDKPVKGIALDGVAAIEPAPEIPETPASSCCHLSNPGDWCGTMANPALTRPANAQSSVASRGQPKSGGFPTKGTFKYLVVRMYFSDAGLNPSMSDARATQMVADLGTYYRTVSYGLETISPVGPGGSAVTPTLLMPQTKASYGQYVNFTDVRNTAKANGYDPANYDDVIAQWDSGTPGGADGLGTINGQDTWLNGDSALAVGIAYHEVGHNHSLNHYHAWKTNDGSTLGSSGTLLDTGGMYEPMGGVQGSVFNNHFTAYSKWWLGWLPTANVTDVTTSGTYALYAFDGPIPTGVQAGALRIACASPAPSRNYWIQFRQALPDNDSLNNGVEILWAEQSDHTDHNQTLLDTTPGDNDFSNAALHIGKTLADTVNNIYITPIGKNGTSPNESVNVVVNMGAPPVNTITVTLSANPPNPAPGTVTTLTCTATDSDNNTVHGIAWDFGDGASSFDNSATQKRAWLYPGTFNVKCTVSDLRGNSAVIKTLSVTVSGTSVAPPAPWAETDIGSPPKAGSSTYAIAGYGSATYAVSGNGGNINGFGDQFHFVYQQITGDCTIIARVVSQTNTDPGAESGVMARADLTGGNTMLASFLTPGGWVSYQQRTGCCGAGGASAGGGAPVWVKVTRTGNTLTGYHSGDGINWSQLGSNTDGGLPATIYFGLFSTSNNTAVLCNAVFDHVSVFTPGKPANFLVEAAGGGAIGNQMAGLPFNIRITARDENNATVSGFTGKVNLTSTGTLSSGGGTTAAFVNGVLASAAVTISNNGVFSITATQTGATASGTSNPFNVAPPSLNNFLVEAASGGNIGTQTAGTPFNIRITARDSSNATVTAFNGTVNVTSTGTLSSGGGTTANFVNGVLVSTAVTLSNTGSFTITATHTGGVAAGSSNAFTVNPGALNNYLVEAAGGGAIIPQTPGVPFNIRITARDANNNTVTGFTGTVSITSTGTLSAGGGTSPSFVAGVLTSHSVTISTSGTFTLTATRTGGAETGTSAAFTVARPPASFLVEAAGGGNIGTQTASSPFNIRITALDVNNAIAAGFTGTVTITSTGLLSSGGGTTANFVAGVLTTHAVTISNTGSFTLTATNGTLTGTSVSFTVNAGALNNLLVEAAGGGNIGVQTAGTAFNIKITARDSNNNTVTSFNGTAAITSTGTLATGPLTSANFFNGVLFSQAVTITNTGSFTITATAGGSTAGTSGLFTVAAGALNNFLVEGPGGGAIPAQTAGAPFSIRIAARDAWNNIATSFNGTVTISSTGTLSAGSTSGNFVNGVLTSTSVTILNTGTFTITVSASGAIGTAPVTVVSGRVSKIIVTSIQSTTAGKAFDITVAAQDSFGNITPAYAGTVRFTSIDKQAVLPASYTFTATDSGNHKFTAGVTLKTAGNQTLTVTDGAAATLTASQQISVSPASATQLAFNVLPAAGTPPGTTIAPAVSVVIEDAFGNIVTNATNPVTIAIGSNPGNGKLSGTLTVNAVNGVATFGDLSFDSMSAYTLNASSPGLTGVTSPQLTSGNVPPVGSPPTVLSTLNSTTPVIIAGQPVPFTFGVASSLPVTYTWTWGDGTSTTTNATTTSHTFTTGGALTITVIATDSSGLATISSMTVNVLPPNEAGPATLCGANPLVLKIAQINATLRFPSELNKDSLTFKAVVQLPDGFSPLGQTVAWNIGGIQGSATLDANGKSPNGAFTKVTLKYKKPGKGKPFTSRQGTLSISMRGVSLSTLNLGGITALNANNVSKKGDPAAMGACVTIAGTQTTLYYYATGISGLYKAKKDKQGVFSARLKVAPGP